jgi:hypothetical protein
MVWLLLSLRLHVTPSLIRAGVLGAIYFIEPTIMAMRRVYNSAWSPETPAGGEVVRRDQKTELRYLLVVIAMESSSRPCTQDTRGYYE